VSSCKTGNLSAAGSLVAGSITVGINESLSGNLSIKRTLVAVNLIFE
jgi:hypothetical protein